MYMYIHIYIYRYGLVGFPKIRGFVLGISIIRIIAHSVLVSALGSP